MQSSSDPSASVGGEERIYQHKTNGRCLRARPPILVTLDNFLWADRTAPEPATHLSNVCLINFRWYVTCLPWS
jgi:hypothetical protein